MSSTTISPQNRKSTNQALGLAIGSVLLLLAGLSIFNPEPIADEGGHHLHTIAQFYNGNWSLPDDLPMLPTYHAVAALCWKVLGPRLVVLRALSAIIAVFAIVVFGWITRYRAFGQPGDAILHFAWLPILFPFLAMVYTEAMSMLCLVLAVYMHVRRRFLLSAGMLLLACLVRQSNAVWVVFMAVWAVADTGRELHASTSAAQAALASRMVREGIRRVWGHAVVLALAAAFFIFNRGPTLATVEANRPRFNVAQLYLFAMFVMFLWVPIWLSRLRRDVRAFCQWAAGNPTRACAVVLAAVGAVLVLVAAYDNPHRWNWNVNYIRNSLLVAMWRSPGVRLAVACLIILIAPIMVRFTREQVDRRLLGVLWLLSLVFLLPHSLAEPRYYIVPMFFINLFTGYTAQQARRQTLWYLAVSLAIAVFTCVQGHAGGGVW